VLWAFTCRLMEFCSWKTVDLAIQICSHDYVSFQLRLSVVLFLFSSHRLLTLVFPV
jgi:hypothetical protein